MIDQINIKTETRRGSSDTYDVATVWIAGTPFRSDLNDEISERKIHRIAARAGIEVLDRRTSANN